MEIAVWMFEDASSMCCAWIRGNQKTIPRHEFQKEELPVNLDLCFFGFGLGLGLKDQKELGHLAMGGKRLQAWRWTAEFLWDGI